MTCRGNGDMIQRYDSLRDILYTSAQSGALAPRKEVSSFIISSMSHPADVYLPCWSHGQPAVLDVSVIPPVQQLTVTEAAVDQGYALTVRE